MLTQQDKLNFVASGPIINDIPEAVFNEFKRLF